MSCRRFLAKPAAARAQVKPASPPQARETSASTTSSAPVRQTTAISAPALMLLTRPAVMKGRKTSITTSRTIRNIVRKVGRRYSLTQPRKRLNIR